MPYALQKGKSAFAKANRQSFSLGKYFGLNIEPELPREQVLHHIIRQKTRVPKGTLVFLVGLFIPDLLKGKEPRLTKHIPKVPKMLVFTKNFETRKEYDYGKVHH